MFELINITSKYANITTLGDKVSCYEYMKDSMYVSGTVPLMLMLALEAVFMAWLWIKFIQKPYKAVWYFLMLIGMHVCFILLYGIGFGWFSSWF